MRRKGISLTNKLNSEKFHKLKYLNNMNSIKSVNNNLRENLSLTNILQNNFHLTRENILNKIEGINGEKQSVKNIQNITIDTNKGIFPKIINS